MQQRRCRHQCARATPATAAMPARCSGDVAQCLQLAEQAGFDREAFPRREALSPYTDGLVRQRLVQPPVQVTVARRRQGRCARPSAAWPVRTAPRGMRKCGAAFAPVRAPGPHSGLRICAAQCRVVPLPARPHGRPPFEVAFVIAIPAGIDPRDRHVAPVADQVNEAVPAETWSRVAGRWRSNAASCHQSAACRSTRPGDETPGRSARQVAGCPVPAPGAGGPPPEGRDPPSVHGRS